MRREAAHAGRRRVAAGRREREGAAVAKLTESVDEYLEAIFKLSRGDAVVTVGQLADALGVSPPSVSEMVRRLRVAGLVADDEGRGVVLTTAGRTEGARRVRRHRLSERFLVDVLDMPWDAVHDEACRLEHALSPEVEARLAAQLGHPRTCPHGQAIPGEDGELDEPALRPLSALAPGDAATIGCVAEEEPDLLRYLASLGLLPDTQVAVESVAPFGGPVLVRVHGAQYALGREVAGKILVRD
jgi:DtxR family transcriptional regulator, Mn-dependent transcriptional regulator